MNRVAALTLLLQMGCVDASDTPLGDDGALDERDDLLDADSSLDYKDDASADIVTDLNTGERMLLENGDGETLVTNLQTNEVMIVSGELAGALTDEEFTERRQGAGEIRISTPYQAQQGFNFSASSWESFRQAKVAVWTVNAAVNIKTSNGFGRSVNVELLRDDWFLDTSYGKKSMWLTPNFQYQSYSWATNGNSGDFYIKISKVGAGGDVVSGTLY